MPVKPFSLPRKPGLPIKSGSSRMLKKVASGVLGPLLCSRTLLHAPRANGPAALLDGPF